MKFRSNGWWFRRPLTESATWVTNRSTRCKTTIRWNHVYPPTRSVRVRPTGRRMNLESNSAPDSPKKSPQFAETPVCAKAAAEFLQMHVRSVTRLAGIGHIPGHPIGFGQRKRWLFYISELDEWLRAQVCSESSRRRQGKGGQVA